MNNDIYNRLSDEQKGWVDAAADDALSVSGGAFYDRAAAGGLKLAAEAGVEIIELSDEEQARWTAHFTAALEAAKAAKAGGMVVSEIISIMRNGQ